MPQSHSATRARHPIGYCRGRLLRKGECRLDGRRYTPCGPLACRMGQEGTNDETARDLVLARRRLCVRDLVDRPSGRARAAHAHAAGIRLTVGASTSPLIAAYPKAARIACLFQRPIRAPARQEFRRRIRAASRPKGLPIPQKLRRAIQAEFSLAQPIQVASPQMAQSANDAEMAAECGPDRRPGRLILPAAPPCRVRRRMRWHRMPLSMCRATGHQMQPLIARADPICVLARQWIWRHNPT